ncbi:LysR substrate-binding domain-containing protein [Aliirhizobium terrae]|uniref:LysR substrate-binding domain-containing protein n=1 Tax=Terrirhizobium terrae TaxID=2926709 RepID=UPI00336AC66B
MVSFSGERFRGVTDVALAKVGRKRRVVLSVTRFLALVDVLKTTGLIAVVPSRLAKRDPGLVTMEPPIPVASFSKILVWHDRTHRDRGHQWFRSILIKSGGEMPPAVDAY